MKYETKDGKESFYKKNKDKSKINAFLFFFLFTRLTTSANSRHSEL